MGFTVVYIGLAVFANWVHNTHIVGIFNRIKSGAINK